MTTKSFESQIEFTLRFCHQIESKSHADGTMVYLTPATARYLLADLSHALMEYDVQTGKVLPNE